ncbi:MAG: dTDP-glucose 4,6-dehydratase [Thermodesulfobacteriota bacterium]
MAENILITGGAGFIGSNFTRRLLKNSPEADVTVLDKLTYAGNLGNLGELMKKENFSFEKGGIEDAPLVERLFAEKDFDIVVNFAAESHVDRSILGPKVFLETNIMGTFTLLEAARSAWLTGGRDIDKRRFIHVSTDEVYGSLGEEGYFTESTPYQPNSPYSASKAASDHLARAYYHTYGLPVITTNCSNNYGPYQFPEKLIPLIIINALKGEKLPVYGDGANIRDWIYVEDHCAAVLAVMRKGLPGEVYNIGGRNEQKNLDIVNLICSIVDKMITEYSELAGEYPFNKARKELITFVTDRPGHDRRYAIDSAKIEQELGWQATTDFTHGMEKTVAWYVKNRSWWEAIISGEYMKYYEEQYGNISGT